MIKWTTKKECTLNCALLNSFLLYKILNEENMDPFFLNFKTRLKINIYIQKVLKIRSGKPLLIRNSS